MRNYKQTKRRRQSHGKAQAITTFTSCMAAYILFLSAKNKLPNDTENREIYRWKIGAFLFCVVFYYLFMVCISHGLLLFIYCMYFTLSSIIIFMVCHSPILWLHTYYFSQQKINCLMIWKVEKFFCVIFLLCAVFYYLFTVCH